MRISSFFVLAGYLAANAYVAARTSVFCIAICPSAWRS